MSTTEQVEPRRGPLGWLRQLTMDQWEALWRDHPVQADPGTAATYRILGLYLVAGLSLCANEYLAGQLWKLLPSTLTEGSLQPLWRRCGWAWGVAFFYCVPTWLYARYVMGLRLRDLGFQLRGLTAHLPMYLAFFGLVLPFVVVLADHPAFLKTYPMAKAAGGSWVYLGLWLVAYAAQFVGVEFFFRGFMLFGPLRVLGPWVLPAMVVPYLMLHFSKPGLESVGSIIAGTTLGIVALRTRSIYAGILIHVAVAWSMELMAFWHRGDLPRLLGYPTP